MFRGIGKAVTRWPWVFTVIWLVAVLVGGIGALTGYGHGTIFDRMKSSESLVENTESDDVHQLLAAQQHGENLVAVIDGVDLKTNIQKIVPAVMKFAPEVQKIKGVEGLAAPFLGDMNSPQAKALLSTKGDAFAISVTMKEKNDVATRNAIIDDLKTLAKDIPGAKLSYLSQGIIHDSLMKTVQSDLIRGESVGLPVDLLLMIIVFGGVIAAGLPLAAAMVSIGIGVGILLAFTYVMDIESFVLNVISLIGLALTIDYGLLVVSRYREEIVSIFGREGFDIEKGELPEKQQLTKLVKEAVIATVVTSGRTVSFSAFTIVFAISGMFVMQAEILRTIALGGVCVVLLAVLSSVTLVPALLTILRGKMVKPSKISKIPGFHALFKKVGDSASDHGIFSKIARRVHAHPWLTMIGVVAALAVMTLPISNLTLRTDTTGFIAKGTIEKTAYTTIQEKFPALATPDLQVVAKAADAEKTYMYLQKNTDDLRMVLPPQPIGDTGKVVVNVLMNVKDHVGPEVTAMVEKVRGADLDVEVGGAAALQKDFNHTIHEDLPLFALIVVIAVLILMFLMTGSVIMPIKALIVNGFSLAASLSATSWVFQHGYLGLPETPGLSSFVVVCVLAFGFGLAMDYEVFLLARIKEFWDRGHDNDRAVELGLQRSGRIITSAAAIIIAVFVGFVFGDMEEIKQIGVALAITVATDATLVRMLLVPSTMTILGKWNWWSPPFLRKVYERFKIVH